MQNWINQTVGSNIMRFVVGGLVGACLMLLVGMAGDSDGPGAYQCCAAGDDASSVFVLDTQTGQVWLVGRREAVDLGTPLDRKSIRTSIPAVVR